MSVVHHVDGALACTPEQLLLGVGQVAHVDGREALADPYDVFASGESAHGLGYLLERCERFGEALGGALGRGAGAHHLKWIGWFMLLQRVEKRGTVEGEVVYLLE